MAVNIRPYAPGDRDAVIGLIDQLNRHEDAICGDRVTGLSAAALCLEANDARVLRENGAAFVAEIDGAVVGYMVIVTDSGDVYVRRGFKPWMSVIELVVEEASRGRGVGAALLGEAERRAREAGAKRLTIGAIIGNDGATRLYERVGFEPEVTLLKKELT